MSRLTRIVRFLVVVSMVTAVTDQRQSIEEWEKKIDIINPYC